MALIILCPWFWHIRYDFDMYLDVFILRLVITLSRCHNTLHNINTSHRHSNNYTGFLSNKESITLNTKSVFSHTNHLQINNLHISTIVFHFRHILFLHDLLIHLFFPFHVSGHHLAKGLSLSSAHDSGINSLLIPETRLLYQYSVPGSKHTFSKLRSHPRLFPISLDCLPDFDTCYSHFMPFRATLSVRHREIYEKFIIIIIFDFEKSSNSTLSPLYPQTQGNTIVPGAHTYTQRTIGYELRNINLRITWSLEILPNFKNISPNLKIT